MPIEAPVNYIEDLNETWPAGPEDSGDGDNHLVNIKVAVKGSFPNLGQAPVTGKAEDLNAFIPIGGIIMFNGTLTSLPGNFQLCDGTNSTPDLRGQFIIGANDQAGIGNSGGSADAVVVSHNHTQQAHTHTTQYCDTTGAIDGVASRGSFSPITQFQTSSAAPTISTEGVSGTNANLPPYYTLAYIRRMS